MLGATGGVGSLAVQMASHAGVIVIAPALPEDGEYLRVLGVHEIVDRSADVAAAVRGRHPDGVDGILDLVSFIAGGACRWRPDRSSPADRTRGVRREPLQPGG